MSAKCIIINREDYPMVTPEGWKIYENTKTRLPCICQGCGCIVYKRINDLNTVKRCYCKKCAYKLNSEKLKRVINKEDFPMVTPEGWEIYKGVTTRLPCICQGCGCITYKTINKIEQQKSCYCWKCSYSIKRKQINIERHGVESTNQLPEVKDKKIQTTLKNYGVKYPMQSIEIMENAKITNLERHGVEYTFQSEIVKEKTKNTLLEKHGVEHPLQSKKILKKAKNTLFERHGVEHALQSQKLVKKSTETKRKNKTFNTSKPEDECFYLLSKLYDKSNIKRNYNKDPRYPFCADFYIISEDLFIECNFFFSHGKELYNPKNKEHQQLLNKWKNKKSKFYDNCIIAWTIKDPLKFKTATDNNLKYLSFYTMKEFENWYYSIYDKIEKHGNNT